MKLYLYVVLTILFALLGGCAQQNIKDVLNNLDKDCVRHYAGSISSGVPPAGALTFTIDCKPSGVLSPPPSTPTP